MTDKEKIRAEIERRIHSIENCPFIAAELGAEQKVAGEANAYKDILAFIDSLPDEPIASDKFPGITRFCEVADNLTRIASGEPKAEDLEAEIEKCLKEHPRKCKGGEVREILINVFKDMKAHGDDDEEWYGLSYDEILDFLENTFINSLPDEQKYKTNPLFEECLANVDPAIRKEVSDNIDKMNAEDDLEKEVTSFIKYLEDNEKVANIRVVARHFAEWGAEHLAKQS